MPTRTRTRYALTKLGDSLAGDLLPYIGMTEDIRRICAGLVRHANKLHNYGVLDCNGTYWHQAVPKDAADAERLNRLAAQWENNLAALIDSSTARVLDLVACLPDPDGGPWVVEVQGDPRGAVVALFAPDGRRIVVERGRGLA
jgi:hypothetical protein